MSADRYRLEVSAEVLQTLQDAVCVRKVDIELSIREASARAERGRAAQNDDLSAMSEGVLSEQREKLVAIEHARHAVFSAPRVSQVRIARVAARRRPR
jgi:hypothetical protein